MNAEEAVAVLDVVLKAPLSDVQEIVFRRCLEGQTYAEIAESAGYDTGYIKDVGAKLWQFLSVAFGERVTKNNLQAVLRRQQSRTSERQLIPTAKPVSQTSTTAATAASNCIDDWGDAVDVPNFYGRVDEQNILTQWLVTDCCRVVSVLGMGGIGKTSLTIKLGQQFADPSTGNGQDFRFIIWRSLRNAAPPEEMLADWIRFLQQNPEAEVPADFNAGLVQLIQLLRSARCLLILDNVETILQGGEQSGFFYDEYAGYGEIFKRLAELPHQSCLLLTSRETPRPLMALTGDTLPVRTLRLSGVSEAEAQQILESKGQFQGSVTDWQALTQRYAGNPLALKLVANTIQELFDGSIADFIAEGTTVFDDIRYLLSQQFNRLSRTEQSIMYWLAIYREPIQLIELQEDVIPALTKSRLMDAMGVLRWRSLIEKTVNQYTQQPVVMEYVTERLVEQICEEIANRQPDLFLRHALIQAPAKDYVRESQIRLILKPLIHRLQETFYSSGELELHLKNWIDQLREQYQTGAGYAIGNLLNLLRELQSDLTGYDLSNLAIWSAYLQDIHLQGVDFSGSDLRKSVFAQRLGSILSVAFSPNGKLLASSDAEGEICLWQVSDGKQLLTWKDQQPHWVWSLAFSADSQKLVSSNEDRVVRIWDINSGECLQECQGHTNWVFAVCFCPDGQQVVSGSEDGTVRLWQVESGICTTTFTGHTAGVRSVAVSTDGKWIVSGGEDQTVRLWNRQTGDSQFVLSQHQGVIRSVCFSPDNRWFASSSDDQTVRLWNLKTGLCEQIWDCGRRTWSVAFSPDSQFCLTGSDDRIRLWEIHTAEPIRSFDGHKAMVLTVAFNPDGQTAVSGSDDQTIKFWEVDTGRCLKTVKGHNNWIWSVDVQGEQMASGHEDGIVRLWHPETGRCLHQLEGHQGRVWSVAYSPRGNLLASGSDDQTIRFWQLHESRSRPIRCLQTLRGQTGAVRLVVFSPDGMQLASNSGDQTVKLWDVRSLYGEKVEPVGIRTAGRASEWVSGHCLTVLEGQSSRVFSIAFSPDGEWLATGAEDGSVYIWKMPDGTYSQQLMAHSEPVEAIQFHPYRSYLVSGSHDGGVKIWDIGTGTLVTAFNPQVGRVLTLDFNPEGDLLAIGGSSASIALWNVETEELQTKLEGHLKPVQTVRFSPDGQYLASGSEDETSRWWSVASGQTVRLLRPARPYEGLNLTGVTGLTTAQKTTLKLLGAIEADDC